MKAKNLRYLARARRVDIPLQPWVATATKRNICFTNPLHAEKTGFPLFRIVAASVASLVVPVGGGTLLMNLLVADKSEAAEDTIVSGFDAELITVKEGNDMTFAAETSEFERTIWEEDTVICDLVASGTVTTNWAAGDATLSLFLLPLDVPGETFGQGLIPVGSGGL